MTGKHVELGAGVIEHLLITGTVTAESGAVAGELATGHHRAFHARPPFGLGPVTGDDRIDLLGTLQETKVAVAFQRPAVDGRQHQVERLACPEVRHVLHANSGIGQRHYHRCPLAFAGTFSVPDLRDSPRLIGADASHHVHRCILGRKAQAAEVFVNDPDLEVDGAKPGYRVWQVLPFADQGFEWFALAASSGVIHLRKSRVIIAKFQPDNRDRPALGTLTDELQGGWVFLPGIGEGDDQTAQVIVSVQNLAQHVGAGPTAREADDRPPSQSVVVHGYATKTGGFIAK